MDDKKNEKNEEGQEEQRELQPEEKIKKSEEEILERIENEKKEDKEYVLLQQLAESEDKYRRALADYQNLVRRTVEEKREWARFSSKELVLKLLPILDTLMLAEKHTQDKNFALVTQQFLSALQEEGIKRIKTMGEEFNPQTMEAVTTAEGKSGKVLEELRAGYMMYDTILRPAQVVVGKEKE